MHVYEVLTSVNLGYGSSVGNPNPTHYKEHKIGAILKLDSETPNGNVWFIDSDGSRGRVQCGSVQNLINIGNIKFVEICTTDRHSSSFN